MENHPGSDQSPAEVRQGLEALRSLQTSVAVQNNDRDAVDERRQKAKATQREFVIRLYVTSALVIVVLSFGIYLMMRLS